MKKQVLIILAIFLAFGTLFAQNDLQPLATIKLNNFNTSNSKNMDSMFYCCRGLETIVFSNEFN